MVPPVFLNHCACSQPSCDFIAFVSSQSIPAYGKRMSFATRRRIVWTSFHPNERFTRVVSTAHSGKYFLTDIAPLRFMNEVMQSTIKGVRRRRNLATRMRNNIFNAVFIKLFFRHRGINGNGFWGNKNPPPGMFSLW